jgi:hypothetical protein
MAGGDDDYGEASKWERRLSLDEPTCYQASAKSVPSQCQVSAAHDLQWRRSPESNAL